MALFASIRKCSNNQSHFSDIKVTFRKSTMVYRFDRTIVRENYFLYHGFMRRRFADGVQSES